MVLEVTQRLQRGFTKRQVLTLLAFMLAEVAQAICVSLQAPFYPMEAERKGAAATEYGIVFGIFELVVCFSCPLIGPRLVSWGAKRVFHAGIFVTGSCAILFGLLDFIEDHTWFIGLSILIRAVEAVGNSCFLTGSFSIISEVFPDKVGSMFALLESFFGLGLIIGPTVGGALYQAFGYVVPFALLGSFLVFASIATTFILPPLEDRVGRNPKGMMEALKVPIIALATFSILVASSSIGFLLTALEPHMRRFDLSPVTLGLMFVLNGGSYSVSAPVWGALCDSGLINPLGVNAIGAVLILVGFTILGPAPFIPTDTQWGLCIAGLILHGLGIGGMLVSSFSASQRGAQAAGYNEGMETYGMISGLWTAVFAFGAFLGPTVAGLLMDHCGIRWATQFITASCVVHLALCVAYGLFRRRQAPSRSGYLPIDEEEDSLEALETIAEEGGALDETTAPLPKTKRTSNGKASPIRASSSFDGTVPRLSVRSGDHRAGVLSPSYSATSAQMSMPRSPYGLFGGVHGYGFVHSHQEVPHETPDDLLHPPRRNASTPRPQDGYQQQQEQRQQRQQQQRGRRQRKKSERPPSADGGEQA